MLTPLKYDEGEVLGDREKDGLPSNSILNYMASQNEEKEEYLKEKYGCGERRGEVRAYIRRGKTLWRERESGGNEQERTARPETGRREERLLESERGYRRENRRL